MYKSLFVNDTYIQYSALQIYNCSKIKARNQFTLILYKFYHSP